MYLFLIGWQVVFKEVKVPQNLQMFKDVFKSLEDALFKNKTLFLFLCLISGVKTYSD